MLTLLREPVPPLRLALLSAGLAAAVALYCLGYTALAGRPETVAESFGWAIVNVLPWIPAIEFAKRAPRGTVAALAVGGGLAASLLLGFLLIDATGSILFEAWRRVPALAVVTAIAVALRWAGSRASRAANDPLPLLPRQIDWVQAAGNYVELRAGDRTIVHRGSITAAERDLAAHGFVRIHRSILVRRDRIARVRPQDVVLVDGTQLKVGKRYRSDLAA
jgi:hypothetical protein